MSYNPEPKPLAQKLANKNNYFLPIALLILLLPPIIFLILHYIVPNQASAAFMTIALVIALKIGFIAYILKLSMNTTKVKTD